MRLRRRHNLGFTLLEVLVAMLVVSMITAGLAMSMHVAFRARRAATDGLDTVRAARLALDVMGRDFQTALKPTVPSSSISLIGPFVGFTNGSDAGSGAGLPGMGSGMGQTSTVTANPVGVNTNITQVGVGDSVTFSNTADPTRASDGAGDIEQVTFALVAESDLQLPAGGVTASLNGVPTGNAPGPSLVATPTGGTADNGVLVRRVTRHLLAPQQEIPTDQVLCRHVRSFTLAFYDGSDWVGGWNSASQNNTVPTAVEVTLELAAPDTAPGSLGAPGSGGSAGGSAAASSFKIVRVYALPAAAETTTPGEDIMAP